MDSDREKESLSKRAEARVKKLQENLFPVVTTPKTISPSGGYLMNMILKTNNVGEDDQEQQCLTKKESKELFALVKDSSTTIQPARWPTECQVLDEKIELISYAPPQPEPYYTPTGREVQPKPVGEELGVTIYQYYPISAVNYFSRSNIGGSNYLLPTCPTPEEDSLRFESRFESGNLAKAIKITAIYYELYLRTDLYTNKHMQWFYFRVSNMKKNVPYRFSIVNMTKDESLYNEGMKPLLYSTKDAQLHSIGWRRCGNNVTYYCNENVGPEDPDQVMTYTLTFTLEFPHEGDAVYLAYSYPYTYTELQDYLLELSKHPVKSTYTTLRLLCKTLAGNNLYYVTITAPQEHGDIKKKRAVVVTARVHPGEAPSSWIMKGILDFLTGDTGPAKELREKFIFKLVPMLNPDGVIVGNNRCSLTGRDLNRQYRTVIREMYPSIWYTKLMIRRMLEECGVAMYCDLHAHSRKHNIFIYGCESRRVVEKRLGEQVYPLMLHKNAADKFSFESCKFRIQRCKEGTGRVVMWMMGIANSYTMEASFAGSLLGARAETHFTTQDYEQMGRAFCQTLLDFYDDDPRKERLRSKIVERLMKEGSNADEPTNIPLSDYSSDDGDTTTSSSDEVGRDDFSIPLIVPPPSPNLTRKHIIKPKTAQARTRISLKKDTANSEPRKTLPLYKTIIDLPLPQQKTKYTSYSSSDSDFEETVYMKKVFRKRRVKKRSKKQKHLLLYKKHSDAEAEENTSSPRCLSVLDLLPIGKFRSHSWHRTSVLPPPKPLLDARTRTTTQQLAEVQAKLTSLKNRLWFGTGGGDPNIPLLWRSNKLTEHNSSSHKKSSGKKLSCKSTCPPERVDEKLIYKKDNIESAMKKKQNGLRRQMAIERTQVSDVAKIKKSNSLPSGLLKSGQEERNGCDKESGKTRAKKKNKKKIKLQRRVTIVGKVGTIK